MYAFVAGTLEQVGPPTVVQTGGIGYEIWLPERHRLRLPAPGISVRFYTHLQVREDAMTLYGFPDVAEREIFRALLSVNGVGPRMALGILGDEVSQRVLLGIRRGDAKPLLAIKGIGRKIAERIVLELEERAAAWLPDEVDSSPADERATTPATSAAAEEAALILETMGLSFERARSAIEALPLDERESMDVEQILRSALRRVAPPA